MREGWEVLRASDDGPDQAEKEPLGQPQCWHCLLTAGLAGGLDCGASIGP